jgi:SAM-dependent methyltransferase
MAKRTTQLEQETETAGRPTGDPAKVEAFTGRVFGESAGAVMVTLAILGDRLGLFKALDAAGPATSAELAARADVDERYAREWLAALASWGWVTYDPERSRFTLPVEHAAVLAHEGTHSSFGGVFQFIAGTWSRLDALTEAFRLGGGVPSASYGADLFHGEERFSAVFYETDLVKTWLPHTERFQKVLAAGGHVVEIGSGHGKAAINLAKAFPQARITGFDIHAPSVATANERARAAGVADRVRFEVRDASKGLPGSYDAGLACFVLHDMVDPRGGLTALRQALKPRAPLFICEVRGEERLEQAAGPMGAFLYGASLLYCMPVSLAENGEGLGNMGLPPSRPPASAHEGGFDQAPVLPVEDPMVRLFEAVA